MKLIWIGGAIGFILGAGTTLIYFSLATLFSANGKATLAQPKAAFPPPQDRETATGEADKTRSVGA